MLDIEAHPRRPQYPMASEIPLSLSSCDYENNELDWNYDSEAVLVTLKQLQELWAEHSIKATMFKGNINKMWKSNLQFFFRLKFKVRSFLYQTNIKHFNHFDFNIFSFY